MHAGQMAIEIPFETDSGRNLAYVDAMCPLDRVPPLEDVPGIARRARRAWGLEPGAALDLDRLCERLGIRVAEVSLNAPRAGSQAFLLPKADGGFLIEVDPEPRGGWPSVPSRLRVSLARHRKRFLVAHELAHTVFYRRGPSRHERLVPDSELQEVFCDELARALLVPREIAAGLPFTPSAALEIKDRFDVSMEIALRSLVAAHETAVGWLLLQRPEKTLVQWTSATRALTAAALTELQRLADRAVQVGEANGCLGGRNRARALFLEQRRQVVITWDHAPCD